MIRTAPSTREIVSPGKIDDILRTLDELGVVGGDLEHVDRLVETGVGVDLRPELGREIRGGGTAAAVGPAETHPLLASLGPEPLSENFDGEYLYRVSRKRKVAIKNLIMNSRVVVGVGNIYASEALFLAGIHPARAAARISRERCEKLSVAIKDVLAKAISEGGTTLRDFVREEGQPGYFAQRLNVYGKRGEACPVCGKSIVSRVIGQRSSFYCTQCQK